MVPFVRVRGVFHDKPASTSRQKIQPARHSNSTREQGTNREGDFSDVPSLGGLLGLESVCTMSQMLMYTSNLLPGFRIGAPVCTKCSKVDEGGPRRVNFSDRFPRQHVWPENGPK